MGLDRLVIRADAGPVMGAGHVMRCLALGQAWKHAGGSAAFLAAPLAPELDARLRSEGMAVHELGAVPSSARDADQTVRLCEDLQAAWIVIDGYQFDAGYQDRLKQAGLRVLAIDDYGHAGRYVADLIVNQNLHARAELYPRIGPETKLLLGSRFILLRQEFLVWGGWQRRHSPAACRILVTLGGGDHGGILLAVIAALRQLASFAIEARVLCGAGNARCETLVRAAESAPFPVELLTTTTEMPALMAWADVAVSGGGSTCWEMAFMGLPALAIVLADNQQPVVDSLERLGVVIGSGRDRDLDTGTLSEKLGRLLTDCDRRAAMSLEGRTLVDGLGTTRLVDQLRAEQVNAQVRA
jgi:UDP-2,4-diacetamido-2,4,6-trideoxy-beta-L-altropyranose hydrolase